MGIVFAFLIAIAGGAGTAAIGIALASAYASATRMSSFEGKSGYFVFFVGGIGGFLLGFAASGAWSLSAQGYPFWSAPPILLALLIVGAAIGRAGIAAAIWARGELAANTAKPSLAFEIRTLDGSPLPEPLRVSVLEPPHASREADASRTGPSSAAGSAELYLRTSQRDLIVFRPGETDVFFRVQVGATPRHSDAFEPWRGPDRAFDPGAGRVVPLAAGGAIEARWRVRDPNVEYLRPIYDVEIEAAGVGDGEARTTTVFAETRLTGSLARGEDGVWRGGIQMAGPKESRVTVAWPSGRETAFDIAAPKPPPWPLSLVRPAPPDADFRPWVTASDATRYRLRLR